MSKTFKLALMMTSNVRDQRRRAVGAPLAEGGLRIPLAVPASGVTTSDDRCIALLAGLAKFLAKHATQGALERLVGAPHVFAQGSIDEGLVIAAAGLMHAALEPGDDIVVEADSNALLALRHWHNNSALGLGKVVFLSHQVSS
jgi:hypothetical protein